MSNTDLFERPIYTVHKNGLFGLTTKASVTEKISNPIMFDNIGEWDTSNVTDLSQMFTPRPGVYEQMQGGNHIYEDLTPERVREVIEEVFRERPAPTIIGGPETQRMFDQAFRDQLMTGSSTISLNYGDSPEIDNGTRPNSITSSIAQSITANMVPYQRHYDIMRSSLDQLVGEERTRLCESSPQEDRRRLVANTLQRQLQQGEISAMEYLDLISQQE